MKTTGQLKYLVGLCASLLLVVNATAQTTDYCKGLKNPTSFVITSAGNSANAQWYGFTGSRENQVSQCGNWGMRNWGSQIPASQLASQTSGSPYCTSASPASTNINGQGDQMNRFVIKGPGYDALTYNHLSYLPPDPTYTSSIRLGNNCGGQHEAEMLCYQFQVRPQNSLIFIWYALSLQNGQHPVSQNPEFAIEIERLVSGSGASAVWQRIGNDTLCYIRPTPASGAALAPFYAGSTGTQSGAGYGDNIYLPWNKVAINLNNYLYETVRIRIGAGDCNMTAHYGCAYIAGECQPMEIKTSGCPAGATQMVQELTAPSGLENYVWFKCNSGTEGISSLYNVPASINFTQLTPNTSTNNVYRCQIEDFYLTEGSMAGQYTNEQVFRCDMTSRMNETIPFTSKVYVRVKNTKPTMSIDTLKSCDSEVTLTNNSYVPNDIAGCDTTITKWWFYAGSDTLTPIVDSAVGSQVSHRWPDKGRYAVKVRSFNNLDHTCFTDSTYVIHALGRPHAGFTIYPGRDVCAAETVILQDTSSESIRRDWIFYDYVDGQVVDSTIVRQGEGDNDTIHRVFVNYRNPIVMVAYNHDYTRDSINTYDTIWCTSRPTDAVVVFQHPELSISGDTVVCNGEQTNITVNTETEGCRYLWYLDTLGNGFISEGQTLRTMPYADTCVYYVKVISPMQCEAWCSVNAYRVNPTLAISRHDMCAGDAVTLTADNAFSYSWTASPADSTLDQLLDPTGHGPEVITVNPSVTTVYTMVGHGTNDCNASPLTEQITVHPIPVATVETNPNFIDSDNPVVTLTDASPYSVRRVWYFDDGVAEEYTSPCSHNFGEVSSDSSAITMVAYNDLDCSDTINFKLPVTQFTFFAPNVFTPERPDNNTFRIFTANQQENFSVYIYDRMGRQVYTSQDLHFAWDGNYEGQKLPQGTYTYVIRYRRPGTEDIVTQKGTVTLLR
jgi:gliding motility-associated-like protein